LLEHLRAIATLVPHLEQLFSRQLVLFVDGAVRAGHLSECLSQMLIGLLDCLLGVGLLA